MKKRLYVLVVEDYEDDYELLVRELRKSDYDIQCMRVETPDQMASALDSQLWDIVFSDWSLPEFSGPRALGVLKERRLDVPFIIVSGTIGEDVAVEALRAGAHDFLVKGRLARLIPALERELRDVQVRRERDKMREQLLISDRMVSMGLLAAGVAHEINNPLTAVLGFLELATESAASLAAADEGRLRRLREELTTAHEAGQRIQSIVGDLKLFSRRHDDELMAVDVERVLDSTLRMAWNQIRHRARLVKDFAGVPPVKANESKLGQVFLNLIVNAAQAIAEGRAEENEIRISTRVDGDGVLVAVADTGEGIAPEVLKQLFLPFFTTKPLGVGTGLGLSICHRIIESLGGSIAVASRSGHGTVFKVFLPLADGAPIASSSGEPASTQARRRGRVLVVDDEAPIGALVQRILHEHDVTTMTHAPEALHTLRLGQRFDVILCDLMMPEMTGMDFYEAVVSLVPEQAEHIVFLTGGTFTHRAQVFLDSVNKQRLDKPFKPKALQAIVNERIR
jgi:signal transduction histidine kinase